MRRQCCSLDCDIERHGSEGYRVGFGFMLWACPTHAKEWKSFDEQRRTYEDKMSIAYQKALERFEEEWDRRYKVSNPEPIHPPYQSSIMEPL